MTPSKLLNHKAAVNLLAADGLSLSCDLHGMAGNASLVFTHGFGQTRQAWQATAAHLANQNFLCLCADARGHGASDWHPDGGYEIDQFVADLELMAAFAGPSAVLVGASFGGLVGLLAQARNPNLFRALVLVDITPRWEAAGVERILAFMRAHPDGFASLDEAAASIAAYLPHRRETRSPQRLQSLLVPRDDGRFRWHWDPALLERIAENGERHQAALVDAARRIDVPVLLLSGSDSDVVSQATIAEFLELVPQARHVVVPRATHMVAGDRNDLFTDAVLSFVRTLPRGRN
ncbi:alpha/beta fold hydrolase [Tahibacter sp.]|uniref:alpha/beta fold hydrolase n=1 Tax=Tahibacter sp. TaxID=2056211 RepID=UPI0039C91B67